MKLNTASAVIKFARSLEQTSAEYYHQLAQRNPYHKDYFLALAKENQKNIAQIERTYYGAITDAIESCFAYDIDSEEYALDVDLPDNVNEKDSISKAMDIEKKISRFYEDAAEQSKSLMADVPKAFLLVTKKRGKRLLTLKEILKQGGAR